MSDPTLADVLAKLDEVQRAIEALRATVLAGRAAPAPAAVEVSAQAPAPAEAPASPPADRAEARSVGDAAAPPAAPPTAPEGDAVSDGEPVEPPSPQPSDGVNDVLRLMFSAALLETEDEAWPHLMALTHSRDLENPRALDYLKAFNWRKLRRSLDRYLAGRDPGSFHIVRTDPAEIAEDAEYVKVFLHQRGGMPGPVHLRRDPKKGGAWAVSQISL